MAKPWTLVPGSLLLIARLQFVTVLLFAVPSSAPHFFPKSDESSLNAPRPSFSPAAEVKFGRINCMLDPVKQQGETLGIHRRQQMSQIPQVLIIANIPPLRDIMQRHSGPWAVGEMGRDCRCLG